MMIRESASVKSTLNRIIEKIVIDCEITANKSSNPESRDVNNTAVDADDPAAAPPNVDADDLAAAPPNVDVAATGPVAMRSTGSGGSEITCRICYDTSPRFPILFPCRCKGTMGAIHLSCLERWLEESNRKSCELCGYEFQVERTPRYKSLNSIVIWLCLDRQHHQLYVRSLRVDLIRCIVVTPVTIICSYVCIVAADFYSINNYDNFPPARWTTYSLLAMMTILIFSFFFWMYMAIHYHQRVWFYWWQKTSIVRVKLSPPIMGINNTKILPNSQLETSV